MKIGILAGFALSATLALAGCGGGGSGSGTVSGATRAAVLLTDSPRDEYGHIWATIYHAELVNAAGTSTVLYDNTEGVTIDLKTLRDAAGQRYSFLGGSDVPAGTYTGLNVTLGATMQVFKNGVAAGDPLTVDAALPKDGAGYPVVAVTFRKPKMLGTGTTNLVLDFDLARFVVRGANVLPAIVEGTTDGANKPERHNDGDYRGVVGALAGTAPNLTFTLTDKKGNMVTVSTSAATALFGAGMLASGANAAVSGTLDTATQTVAASEVRVCGVRDGGGANADVNAARAAGTAGTLHATAGTFALTVVHVRGFVPTMTTVNVVTTATTAYYADGGGAATPAATFATLAVTPNVSVAGTYDAATNTLTATVVKTDTNAHNGAGNGNEVRPRDQFRAGMNRQNWGGGHL